MANDRKNRQQQQNFEDSNDLGRESRVSSPSFDDEDRSSTRRAGSSYGSDMEADDRTPSEQRAENPKPNDDH
jgi:hypothetical protein